MAASAPHTPRRGAMLGRYRVERVLSASTEAMCVLAKGPNGVWVTLTVLGEDFARDPERLRETVRVVRARASLTHPGLTPLRGPFELGGRIGFTTSRGGGQTLAERLRAGPLEPAEAVRLLGHVAAALELAASKGVFHRDLTPDAVLLTAKAPVRARLADFGMTRGPARGCETPDLGPRAPYRSPEELRGAPARRRSAVYALGCILFECVTGSPPYRYDRPLLTVHAHAVEPPPRASERRPELPAALDEVLARALAKDPPDRYGSPAELIEAAGRAAGIAARVPVAQDRSAQRARDRVQTRERRRSRRRSARAERPRLARTRPRLARSRPARATLAVALALTASASVGFATGTADIVGVDVAPREASPAAVEPRQPDYLSEVSRAVRRLDERRSAARRRLRTAGSARAQAAAASVLAAAYGEASETVHAAQGVRSLALPAALGRARLAYRRLARAAKGRDAGAWGTARKAAARSEREVGAQLARLGGASSG